MWNLSEHQPRWPCRPANCLDASALPLHLGFTQTHNGIVIRPQSSASSGCCAQNDYPHCYSWWRCLSPGAALYLLYWCCSMHAFSPGIRFRQFDLKCRREISNPTPTMPYRTCLCVGQSHVGHESIAERGSLAFFPKSFHHSAILSHSPTFHIKHPSGLGACAYNKQFPQNPSQIPVCVYFIYFQWFV